MEINKTARQLPENGLWRQATVPVQRMKVIGKEINKVEAEVFNAIRKDEVSGEEVVKIRQEIQQLKKDVTTSQPKFGRLTNFELLADGIYIEQEAPVGKAYQTASATLETLEKDVMHSLYTPGSSLNEQIPAGKTPVTGDTGFARFKNRVKKAFGRKVFSTKYTTSDEKIGRELNAIQENWGYLSETAQDIKENGVNWTAPSHLQGPLLIAKRKGYLKP